jgi:hypothetical protein
VVTNTQVDETLKIPLFGYEGVTNLQFKFEYVGNLYYWIIDDVSITNETFVDMQLNRNYYATAPAYRTPVNQTSEIPFLVDMFNNGDQTAEDLSVSMDIVDDGGANVYSAVQQFDDLPGYSLNENMAFDETFTPDGMGSYTATYTVDHNKEDEIAENNVINYTFEVTENVFSNTPSEEDAVINTGQGFVSVTDGSIFDAPFFAAGSAYYVPNGAGNKIQKVTFGLDPNGSNSGFVDVHVYQWPVDDGFNPTVGWDVQPGERELVGFGSIFIDPTTIDNFRIIDVPVHEWDAVNEIELTNAMELVDNMNYLVLLSARPFDNIQMGLLAYSTTNLDENIRNFYHNATNQALEGAGLNRVSGTFFEETVTGDIADISGVTFTDYDINTLFTEVTIVDNATGTEDLNTDLAVSTFPNPVSDNLTVSFALENTSDVAIEITTVDGKTVMTKNFTDIRIQSVNFDVSLLESGIYFLNTRTEEGFKTQRIVVQK